MGPSFVKLSRTKRLFNVFGMGPDFQRRPSSRWMKKLRESPVQGGEVKEIEESLGT